MAPESWIKRVKRGLYELAYPEQIVLPDLYVANKLYEPSYISLETALSHYQLLPETAAQVTSVTPNATRRFKNFHGLFTYFSVRPRAFAGYTLIRLQGRTVRIAEPEKAVVDRLYMSLRRGEDRRLVCDRWDLGQIKKMNSRKLASYADLSGQAARKSRSLFMLSCDSLINYSKSAGCRPAAARRSANISVLALKALYGLSGAKNLLFWEEPLFGSATSSPLFGRPGF